MSTIPLVLVEPPRAVPRFLASAAPVTFDRGFYDEEREGTDVYRWMTASGRLRFAPEPVDRCLELWVFSEIQDLSQQLTVSLGDQTSHWPLAGGWGALSVPVPAAVDRADLEASRLFPRAYYPGDARTLAIRMRPPLLHQDAARHAHVTRQHANTVRNLSELHARRTHLASTPPTLGIDLHGACNVKPPCVYCEWESSKALEGPNAEVPFTADTLDEYGPFFDNSVNLVNCSIGEPFMMRNFDELLDRFGSAAKVLEMTTNGQYLTERNIERLLGRRIDLYISLDAATAETYARLRNNRFPLVLENVRRLVAAKGGPGGLPQVHLVFMPMRANLHELEAFVRLCAALRVDRLVLRPLNFAESADLNWQRGGYHFEYQKELLPFDVLVRASAMAARLGRALGVEIADQMDFGGSMRELFTEALVESPAADARAAPPSAAPESVRHPRPEPGPEPRSESRSEPTPASSSERPREARQDTAPDIGPAATRPPLGTEQMPACLEPWKSLYILRRGVLPCCYGAEPIAPMDGYREAWNAPIMQAIRGELLNGRFHDYCLRSTTCPIVRKSHETRRLPFRQQLRWTLRHWANRVDRVSGGRAGRLYRAAKAGRLYRDHGAHG